MSKHIYQLYIENGYYKTNFYKSKDDWMNLFRSKEYATSTEKTKMFLQRYYIEENECGCFSKIYEQYNEPISNSYIKSLGDKALKFFKIDDFSIIEEGLDIIEDSKRWPIFFDGRYIDDSSHFEWKLRSEIVEAIGELDMFQSWHDLKQEKRKIKQYNCQIFSLEKFCRKHHITTTEVNAIVKIRIGQGYFRNQLLKQREKCEICGLTNPSLLIASHIKCWKDSNDDERIDSNNGLLLCTMHDALFDKHLISFDDNGNILISNVLTNTDRHILNLSRNIMIKMNEEKKRYMKEHRKMFNQKLVG